MKHTKACDRNFKNTRQEVINLKIRRVECDSCSASRKLTPLEKEVNNIK